MLNEALKNTLHALKDVMYLGDGVYAGFDGYQVWVFLKEVRPLPLIALDEPVLSALLQYHHHLRQKYGEQTEEA